MAQTIEREDLELVELPSEDLGEEDVTHIACCQWPFYVLARRPHYSMCGVKLTSMESTKEPDCQLCIEIEERTKGHVCPMKIFQEG